MVSSEIPFQNRVNEDGRVEEIEDEEYNRLKLEEIYSSELRSANIDDVTTLDGLEHKYYKFNMESWTEPNQDGFTVKMSEMSSAGDLNYLIIIQENGKVIYQEYFNRAVTLTVKAYHNSRFKVTIVNQSVNPLTYRVKINSYIR